MRLLFCVLGFLALAEPPKVERVVIPLKAPNLIICAEYISQGAPRDAQRACKDASEIREWILRDGRPADECGF